MHEHNTVTRAKHVHMMTVPDGAAFSSQSAGDSLMQNLLQLDPMMTINEIVARYPATIPVFNRFGMDTCCGGGVSVNEAARRDGVEVEPVMGALRDIVERA